MQRLGNRLYKVEKLCSKIAVDRLFVRGEGSDAAAALAFPLRAVWRLNPGRRQECPQFLIVVPKRRLRHAVDRVRMRRLIREAYRLNRNLLPDGLKVDIAFSYVASELLGYAVVEAAMCRLLKKIANACQDTDSSD